jgi:hypothetical protein
VKLGRLAALLCALVCAGLLDAAALQAAPAPAGGVYVTTLPSSADVWFDGTYIGRSPAFIGGVTPGRHAVTVTKSGWAVRELDVSVNADTVALASTRLVAGPRALAGTATGSLVLRAVPAGAALSLDSAPFTAVAGQAQSVPAGPHHLTVSTPHGKTTLALDVLPDTTTNVVVQAPRVGERSAVVAPVEDYLPTDAFSITGTKVVIRYAGHLVIARLGELTVRYDGTSEIYDAAAEEIGSKLYMPLGLLQKLAGDTSN